MRTRPLFKPTILNCMVVVMGLFAPAAANAAVIINATETGGNVLFSYSGNINLTGLGAPTIDGAANNINAIEASLGATLFGNSASMDFWQNPAYVLPVFGAGGFFLADSATGPGFAVYSDGFGIYDGYVSLTALSGSMTFLGDTFATLGMNPGTYIANLPSDTITLNVGPVTPVPEPSSLLILGAGLFGLHSLRRRKANKSA